MSSETQNIIEKRLVHEVISGLDRNKRSWTKKELKESLNIIPIPSKIPYN
jgi:hypothetical protein